MTRVRVLVIEDSATVRGRICEVIASDPALEVVGEASDGKRGIELCKDLRPDVVTMDMMLPVMTGLAATEYIMAYCPTPILVVSSSFNRGELFRTYEALAAGAVDVLEKPSGEEPEGVWEAKLLSALKLVARIRVITHPRLRIGAAARGRSEPTPGRFGLDRRGLCSLVAIGTSTGGPSALVEILRGLPREFAIPVVVVLHIGEPFGASFAEWLDTQSERRVAYARDGEPLGSLRGRVALAPPGKHLVVRGARLWLTDDAERHSCRPSVDVLFESLAREGAGETAACLLTGMGRDGAAGLLAIRRAGGFTIAQDEQSSVVYGMPREAAMLDAAERILPLRDIAPTLAQLREGTR
jgi:two-component system chemotaxis response regulator CheB